MPDPNNQWWNEDIITKLQRWFPELIRQMGANWEASGRAIETGKQGRPQRGVRGSITAGAKQPEDVGYPWTPAPSVGTTPLGPEQPEPSPPIYKTFDGERHILVTDPKTGAQTWEPAPRTRDQGAEQQAMIDYYKQRDEANNQRDTNVAMAKTAEAGWNQTWAAQQRAQRNEDVLRSQSEGAQATQAQGSPGEQIANLQQNAAKFDAWKSQFLASLTEPRDWIIRWQVANKPNPYSQQLQGWASALSPGTTSPQSGGTPQGQMPIPTQLGNWVPQLKGQTALNPAMEGARPQLETPSGQQRLGSSPSELGMAAGYADWSGQSWRDIVDYAKSMLPNNPSSGMRWTPRRQ